MSIQPPEEAPRGLGTIIQHIYDQLNRLASRSVASEPAAKTSLTSGESSGGGGGDTPIEGGVSTWDDLTGDLSGPVPFDATDDSGTPTSRSLRFLNVTPQVDVTSDPASGIALEIKDQTNGNRLGTLTTDGRWETRADQEAFADGSFASGPSTNSLLQVEDAGTVLTTDAASIDFTGSGVNASVNGDDVTVDVSGGSGSDIDIEQNQTPVVGGATGLSFEGSGIDSVNNDGDGTATVNISKGSSTEVQEGGTTRVSDVTTLDFVGGDFSVANPTGGEAEVGLQNDTVTVAGNSVPLGGATGIAHGDLSSIGSDDHHTRPSAGDGLSDSSNTFSVNESQVDHDSLNQYVANEHVDHSGVTISAGTALSGGGDLTASRALNVAGPLTGIPFKTTGDDLEWQADANNDLILQNTTDAQTLLKVDQDTGTVFAAGDVVAFGLSGGGGSGSTSGLQADAPLTLDTTTDPDTVGLDIGAGLTINNGVLETDGSVGYSDSDARSAINTDSDHGSTASHNYTQASDLDGTGLTASGGQLDVDEGGIQHDNLLGGTDPSAHHAVFEPSDYTPVTTVEAHGNALAIDITGNADSVDGYEGSDLAALSEDETVTGRWNFKDGIELQAGGTGRIFWDTDTDGSPLYIQRAPTSSETAVTVKGQSVLIGGAQSPSYTLDVIGDINATGVGRFNITGDADSVDGYEGSDLAALAEDEIITGLYTFSGGGFTQPNSNVNSGSIFGFGDAANTRYGILVASNRSLAAPDAISAALYYDVDDGTATGEKEVGLQADARANGDNTAITLGGLVFKKQASSNNSTATLNIRGGNSLTVAPGGVGIGTLSPSYALEVSGDARSTGEIEAFLGSDRRLKTRLDPLDSALDKVDQLTGYGFDWRKAGGVQPHKRGQRDVGLIAQEVEDVLPEAVKSFADGHSEGYKSVSYDKVVPLLVEAIKDLRSQIKQVQ